MNTTIKMLICGLSFHCASASAIDISLNLNDNQVPAGWILSNVSYGSNFGIANGQLFAGETNSAGWLWTSYTPTSAVSSVTMAWDGNLVNSSYGASTGIKFTDNLGGMYDMIIGTSSVAYGSDAAFRIIGELPGGGVDVYRKYVSLPHQTYRYSLTIENGAAALDVMDNGSVVFHDSYQGGAWNLTGIQQIGVYANETVGDPVYVDNIHLSSSSVPESSTLALFSLGLAGVAATRRARRQLVAQ